MQKDVSSLTWCLLEISWSFTHLTMNSNRHFDLGCLNFPTTFRHIVEVDQNSHKKCILFSIFTVISWSPLVTGEKQEVIGPPQLWFLKAELKNPRTWNVKLEPETFNQNYSWTYRLKTEPLASPALSSSPSSFLPSVLSVSRPECWSVCVRAALDHETPCYWNHGQCPEMSHRLLQKETDRERERSFKRRNK